MQSRYESYCDGDIDKIFRSNMRFSCPSYIFLKGRNTERFHAGLDIDIAGKTYQPVSLALL